MIRLLIRRFVPDYENVNETKVRERYGILGGILGVLCNLVLFAVKVCIGWLMNSIAILSDGFNNLSDMGSSLVTVFGFIISGRKPDREHPFGHGRGEYIASLIVSFIIMMVGLELLKSSLMKILHPEEVSFNIYLLLILILSILVKVWMFSYNRYIGQRIDSAVMRAAAFDSLNDVIATGAVIVSTVIGQFVSFPVDGVIGLCVSGLVLYTGFGIAKDTIGLLLGQPPNPETVQEITSLIMQGEGIVGVHDLIVHDYGPGRVMASVHAEVPDDADIVRVHEVIDALEQDIFHKLGIHIVIHMDPISVNCERTNQIREMVVQTVTGVNPDFSIHDFRMTDGESRINLIFDLVVPCGLGEEERTDAVRKIDEMIKEHDSKYCTVIQIDNAYD